MISVWSAGSTCEDSSSARRRWRPRTRSLGLFFSETAAEHRTLKPMWWDGETTSPASTSCWANR